MPIIIFRIGYIDFYNGIGTIKAGGSHVVKYREGGEMWNFRSEGGRCYGYVKTKNFSGIDLSRIDDSKKLKVNDELKGVDGIYCKKEGDWTSNNRWHKNSNVFHKKYRTRSGNKKR